MLNVQKNMGNTDRIIRVLLALAIVGLYFAGMLPMGWAIGLFAIAGIFVATSFISFCPLYLPFGLSTLRKKKA
jgi:hypothetical protein